MRRLSITQLYPLAALIAVAGGTFWLERATRADDPTIRTEARREADFTAEQTRLISFGADGQQRYELIADRITNYPLTQITELERPQLRYQSQGRELRISARTGEVLKAGDQVKLAGEVRGRRAAAPGSPELTFASESLRVWPDDERAETDDPVILTQGTATTHAGGMKVDNLFGTVDLFDGVTVHMPRTSRTKP